DFSRAFAPVGVQGTAFDALLAAAELLEGSSAAADLPIDTPRLRRRASQLRSETLARFWQPDLGTFAHAVTIEADASLRPARVVTSSPGQLLATHLLDGDDVAGVRQTLARRLMQPDLLAAGGVRTKSTSAPRFRPGSYHNGSTWPWDSGVISDGLRRHDHLA